MRRLLSMLGLIRPNGAFEVINRPKDEGGISIGGPHYIVSGNSSSGPYWAIIAGEPPPGYLKEPDDTTYTYDCNNAQAWLLEWMSVPFDSEHSQEEE